MPADMSRAVQEPGEIAKILKAAADVYVRAMQNGRFDYNTYNKMSSENTDGKDSAGHT